MNKYLFCFLMLVFSVATGALAGGGSRVFPREARRPRF